MNITTRYINASLLFLVLLIPLIFDKSGFYGYVVPKALIFQTCTIFCTIIYLLSINVDSKTLTYNFISLSVGGFGIITLIVNILSYDSLFSVGATFERMEGAVNSILLIIFFFLILNFFRSEVKQKYTFIIMLSVACIVAIFGLFWGEKIVGRLISTIGNPAFLCFYLANHLFLIAIFFTKYKSKYSWSLLILSSILLWAIFQTLTRTFYIASMLSVTTMALLYVFKFIKKDHRIKILTLIILGGISIVYILYEASQNRWVQNHFPISRLTNASTLDSRLLVWKMAYEGFLEYPFLGWGQENFNYVYALFFNPQLSEGGVWYDRSHNVFLDWFVAGGIIGGCSFILIWISSIFGVWRTNFHYSIKIILTGWIVFYCCFIFFNPDSLVNSIFAMILLAFIAQRMPTKSIDFTILKKYSSVVILFLIGVLGTIFYQFTYQNIRSYRVFSKAISEPTIENLIDLSNKAYSIRSAVNLNMVEQLTFMHPTVINSQLSPEQKELYTISLKKLIEKEIKRHPPSVKLLELKSMLELNINDLSAGNRTLDQIIQLSPNYSLAYMQKGKIALTQNKFDDADANFNKVSKLTPNYTPAKIFKLYLLALKTQNYDIRLGLKEIPQIELVSHIKLVRETFSSLNQNQAFVKWIWDKNLTDIFITKPVYYEWIITSFQIGDLDGMKRILAMYSENFQCNSDLILKIAADAQNGIPPNQSLEELFKACPNPR